MDAVFFDPCKGVVAQQQSERLCGLLVYITIIEAHRSLQGLDWLCYDTIYQSNGRVVDNLCTSHAHHDCRCGLPNRYVHYL